MKKTEQRKSGLELHRELQSALEETITADNFDRILRCHIASARMLRSHTLWMKAMRDCNEKIGSKLAAYARRAFARVFDAEPLHATAQGEQGLHTMPDGELARLTVSHEKYRRRNDGDEFTQQFLASLPPGWTRERVSLDASALAKESDETLLQCDIVRQDKATWTIQEKGETTYETAD